MEKGYNSIGIDIFDNKDFKKFKKTLYYTLTTPEKEKFNSLVSKNQKKNYLISRWVAKEAIVKLLDAQSTIRSISVLNSSSGKPYCLEYPNIDISISHSNNSTVCVAIWKNK